MKELDPRSTDGTIEFNLSGILPLRPKPKLRPKHEPKLRPNQGSFLCSLALGNLPKLRYPTSAMFKVTSWVDHCKLAFDHTIMII